MSQPEYEAPQSTRRRLEPFGGLAQRAGYQKLKEEAIRTLPRQECFERGYLTVKDLDDEELRYGRCRDEAGRIPNKNGKRTELIPRDMYDEMIAEHELRYKQKLRERLDDMLDIMDEIARDDTVEPRDRFEAAKYLFERTAGKTPENVMVNVQHAPWEELLSQVAGIAPMSRAEHRELGVGIVEGEIVEVDAEGNVIEDEYWTEGDIPRNQPPLEPEPHQDEPERNYGRRADENRSYAEQVQDAQDLQKRRKEARAKIQNAKKQRKIDRALGADAIKDEITGVTLGENGELKFEQS